MPTESDSFRSREITVADRRRALEKALNRKAPRLILTKGHVAHIEAMESKR